MQFRFNHDPLWIILGGVAAGLIVGEYTAMESVRAWLVGVNGFTLGLAYSGLTR